MKHNNEYYLQLPRTICQQEYNDLSDAAFRLYVMLKEEEQRFIKDNEDAKRENPHEIFWRTNEMLAKDLGWSISKVKRAKEELRKTGLILIRTAHFINKETGRKSEKKVTTFKIY